MSKTIIKKDKEFTVCKGTFLCLEPIFLDTETANNHAENPKDLRTWITSIQFLWGDDYRLIRTPEELCNIYNEIIKKYNLKYTGELVPRVVTYLHNASYDLSYLIPYFRSFLPHYEDEFSGIIEGPNDYLTYCQGPFEWRCSYKLANCSLAKWGDNLNITHKKKVGYYDYSKVLYQDSELTQEEKDYDKYDVLALQECWRKQCDLYNDNLATIPLTSTGYPRRALRISCLADDPKGFKDLNFYSCRLDPEQYNACVKAYAGGYTHNNRFYKDIMLEVGKSYNYNGRKVKVNALGHRDFKSFYPSVMVTQTFPLGAWKLYYTNTFGPIALTKILDLSPEFSSMTWIRIYKAELKPEVSMPFMQKSKLKFDKKYVKSMLEDNGRIVYMENDEGFECYLDNLTLAIINEQYNLEYEVLKVWRSKNKPLPKEIINVVDKYFKGKSDKKNEVKTLIETLGETNLKTLDCEAELMLVKALLNSIYGCTATNPLRDNWELGENLECKIRMPFNPDDDSKTIKEKIKEDTIARLDDYYEAKSSFLPYQVGVWITAYARYELYEYIKLIGYDHIIYCDTDSAYYIKDDEIEAKIEALNAEKHTTAHYVTLENGKREYYDVFEAELDLKAFKGLHSKCYGYVNCKGELKATIAGVPSKTIVGMDGDKPIYVTREQELKELDNLRDGFTFKVNTSTTSVYIGALGKGSDRKPEIIEVDGHKISTAGGAVIIPLKEKRVNQNNYDFDLENELLGPNLNPEI